VAWYQRAIVIPANWKGRNISLFLERSHIQTRFWIDDTEIGKSNSLVASHEFEYPKSVKPGKHVITIRVDNRLNDVNVGPDSHSVSDHTQGNWNGIVGKILLKAVPLVHISDMQVFPDVTKRIATVKIKLANQQQEDVSAVIVLNAKRFNSCDNNELSCESK